MPDDKTNNEVPGAKAEDESSSAKTTPFQEMMAKMMDRCGCSPERMGAMMAACCPPEHKESEKSK